MIIPTKIMELLSTQYKETSITTFQYNINRIFSGILKKNDGTRVLTIQLINRHIKAILEKINLINQSSVTFSLLKILSLINPHSKHLDTIDEIMKQQQIDATNNYKMKQEEVEADLYTWDELMELAEKLKARLEKNPDDIKLNLQLLFANLIKFQPPQRSQIYYNTKITAKNETEGNYLNLNTGTLVLRDFKTAKRYQEVKIKLQPELMSVIKEVHNRINNQWLISRLDGTQHTAISFNAFLMDFIDMGTSKIRSLYVSYNNKHKIEFKPRDMLHSKETSDTIYNKHTESFVVKDGVVFYPVNEGQLIERNGKFYIKK